MEWKLSDHGQSPLYVQIMELVIANIQNGQLGPGEKLPTERQLAADFGVNRSTVVHALEELTSLGWITRRQGSGTRVSEGSWGRLSAPRTNWQSYLSHNVFNQTHPYVQAIKEGLQQQRLLDLFTGDLPYELIPDIQLPSYHWEDFLQEEGQLSECGYEPLQQAVSQRLAADHQLEVTSEQLLITSGAQQALFLILQVLLAPGDSVAIEDPSFLYGLPIFQAAGIRLYGGEMDAEGLKPSALKALIVGKKIKMLLLNPNYQNPTGTTMSLKRRQEILALCAAYQIPVVEDDVFGELNFGERLPLLKQLAPQQVIYLGSLSKILGSSIKIGWICAPASLIEPLAEARQVMDFSLSIFPQVLAANALADPAYAEKVGDLRGELRQRAAALRELMEAFQEDWQLAPIHGGFYAWLTWRRGELSVAQWQLFLQAGVAVAPSFLFSNRKDALRLNFTRLSQANQSTFAAALKKVTAQLREKAYDK